MDNLGKMARALLVAGALALSVGISACGSSGSNSGTGGSSGTGGTTGAGGSTAGGMGGMNADGGNDAPVTATGGKSGAGGSSGTDSGTDTGSTADPHTVHLGIINATTTTGVPVSRPAPAISYDMCKI